jgi:heme exporter protein B
MEIRRILAVAAKDLLVEGRARAALLSVMFFAVIALLLFGFALGPDPQDLADAGAGVIWLAIFFSGILIFSRSYHVELEAGAMEALLGYPGSRRSIFGGKVLANLILLGIVEILLLLVAAVLFHLPLTDVLGEVAVILLLGTFGFVVLGTFYAAISSRSRAREVLLPRRLIPKLVPLIL